MHASARSWVARAAHDGVQNLRDMPPAVLLALLTAAMVSPLFATVAGLSAALQAGSGVLSGLGGGVLSGILTEFVPWLKKAEKANAIGSDPAAIEKQLAEEISRVLSVGDSTAADLRKEIAVLLRRVDMGAAALTVALEEGNEQVRDDILAAIESLGTGFADMRFILDDIAQAAGVIQKDLDEQGASIRVIIEVFPARTSRANVM